MLAIDASHAGMRQASWRAARSARRGGLPNAVFVVSSLEGLPPQLNGLSTLVAVHFPWGSLLHAALGDDADGAERIAALVAPGGLLRLLVSASPRDAGRGAMDIEPAAIVAAYAALGMMPVSCRVATPADIAESRSSWGRRLLTSGHGRQAWLIELRADPSVKVAHEGSARSQAAGSSVNHERGPTSSSPFVRATDR